MEPQLISLVELPTTYEEKLNLAQRIQSKKDKHG